MIGFYPVNEYISGKEFQCALDGFSYYIDYMDEGDNVKMHHYIYDDHSCIMQEVDYSPYMRLTKDQLIEICSIIALTTDYDLLTSE